MPINISGPSTTKLHKPITLNTEQRPAAPADSGSTDKVSLTPLAGLTQQIAGTIAETPVVDSGKVTHMQSIYGDADHKIDEYQVAEKLLNFETTVNYART